MRALFIDTLADELGKAVADAEISWRKRQDELLEAVRLESRATIAELAAKSAALHSELSARVDARLATVKDGRDGIDGKDGKDGLNGKDGANGIDGKPGAPGEKGDPGKDGRDGKDGLDGKDGSDGRDADEESIAERVFAMVWDRRDDLRGEKGDPGRDGIDGKDGLPGKDGARGDPGEPGRDGLDGKDGIDGRDGKDGTPGPRGEKGDPGESGKDGAPGLDGKDGKDGLNGKDGVGITDAIVNSEGVLVLTFTDGETKSVGRVVGKDGAPGRDGRDGAPGGPPGPPGPEGPAGKDGTSIFDAGVWTQSADYSRGAGVTYGGSFWLSQEDGNKEKPGTGRAWRLAVKKGRDGKDVK